MTFRFFGNPTDASSLQSHVLIHIHNAWRLNMTTAAMDRTTVKPSTSPDVYADSPHSKTVMRQTQALIGVTLLAGVAAAYFLSMAWVVVPLVIGLGLVFAGASGHCPMAFLVARMPWNNAAESKHRASSGDCCGGRCS